MQAGAEVQNMRADHHDEVLAATSHLPHVLAYVLVDTLARMSERDEIFEYAAGGFRDFTRIASSDPSLWRDICQANQHALLDMLERYQKDLQEVSTALQNEDYESLLKVFTQAKQARDRYSNNT
jgi:prephenate dehydrogenase